MREKFPGWYPKKPEEVAKLWDTAVFVPDANVLLHCLRHTTSVRDELLRLFEVLGDSLWIPYQVGLEFHRNRQDVEFGALDAYDSLIKDQEVILDKARDRLRQLRAHPTIDVPKELSALNIFLEDFKARMQVARSRHSEAGIEGVVDRVTRIFDLRVGDRFPADKLAALKREGEERYAKKIPPGYKDSKKDAGELDKFGDLILWKEMMAKAKAESCPIIFISDDGKEDWWWIHRGRKIGPRPELVEEFKAESGQEFHIYEFGQFLRFAADRFPEIKGKFEQVEKSISADEDARRWQDGLAEEIRINEAVRSLEDERDQIIAVLSGTPRVGSSTLLGPSALRERLMQVNSDIAELISQASTMKEG